MGFAKLGVSPIMLMEITPFESAITPIVDRHELA
jgi:hypothetical protein